MANRKVCARCGKKLDDLYASVWRSDGSELFYCHDDDDDCYGPATWAGYREFDSVDELIVWLDSEDD